LEENYIKPKKLHLSWKKTIENISNSTLILEETYRKKKHKKTAFILEEHYIEHKKTTLILEEHHVKYQQIYAYLQIFKEN
jgi:hypothetical protein